MDLDEPGDLTPEGQAEYARFKRWQERALPDDRPRLRFRTFLYAVQLPMTLAGLALLGWGWGAGDARPSLLLPGLALLLVPPLTRRLFRVRPGDDA